MAASPKPQLLLLVVAAAAALVVASCHAARLPQATAGGGLAAEKSHRDSSCLELTQVQCQITPCTNYCFSIGLNTTGWCTFKGLNVYCCCPVPAAGATTAELPASLSPSGPQAGLV
ncbi:hypothetical protein VPH35_106945 [Triticum aestivum]